MLLIDLEAEHGKGDLLRTLSRADYLHDTSRSLVSALTLRARRPDASGKAPHTLEQIGRVLGLSKQAVADRVRACDPSALLADQDEPTTAATVTLGLYAPKLTPTPAAAPPTGSCWTGWGMASWRRSFASRRPWPTR